jgi:hypothetical protein
MSTTPYVTAAELESAALLLPTRSDHNEVGAYRLVDLAGALDQTPEEFYAMQLGGGISENLLRDAASRIDPIFSMRRASYDAALADLRAEADAQDLLALTLDEIAHQPEAVIAIPAQPVEGEKAFCVTSITIEGSELRNMYDEHPGFAYFSTASSISVRVPEPLTLNQAMERALEAWKTVCNDDATELDETVPERGDSQADSADEEMIDDDYDGKFSASRIVLSNRAGEVLQEYNGSSWVTDFAPADQWPLLLKQAEELSDEASEEARWDNFDTANGLRGRAAGLRRQVAIARANLPEQPQADVSQTVVESPTSEPEASPLSADQVLIAKRTAMATAFFIARPWDYDHGFDRLMSMRTIQEVKPDLDGWGVVALHDHLRGTALQTLKDKVSEMATSLLHNLSGVSREVANEHLTRYPTTRIPEVLTKYIEGTALAAAQLMNEAHSDNSAAANSPKQLATADSPSFDL